MKSEKKYYLYILLILFTMFSFYCQQKPPEVKVNNLSNSSLNVYFKLAECSCPSFTFDNVAPAASTSYHELTTNKYAISLTIKDTVVGSQTYLKPEMDKQYQVNIDNSYNCKIESFDR
jgi:hypothetical protein